MAEFEAGRGEQGFLASAWGVLQNQDKPTRDRILRWLHERSESDAREVAAQVHPADGRATHWSSGPQGDGGYWVDAERSEVTAFLEIRELSVIQLDGWAIIERQFVAAYPIGEDGEGRGLHYFATREEAEAFVKSMQQPEERSAP